MALPQHAKKIGILFSIITLILIYKKYYSLIHVKNTQCEIVFNEEIFKSIFKLWIKICENLKVDYCLWYGSLLGQVRNQSYIPYDSDIDVLIDIADIKVFSHLFTPRGLKYKWSGSKATLMIQPDYVLPPDKRRLFNCVSKEVEEDLDPCSFRMPCMRLFLDKYHIDIFCIQNDKNTIQDPDSLILFDRKYLFPFKNCQFMNVFSRCPNDPVYILEKYYKSPWSPNQKCQNSEWIIIDQ